MKTTTKICVMLLTLLLFFSLEKSLAREKLSLTVPPEVVGGQQRIARFKVIITSAWVTSLPKVPTGWSICITKGPASKMVVDGGIPVGAYAEYVDFFNEFIIVEKFEKMWIPFDINMEIVTLEALEASGEDERVIVPIILEMKDIIIRKIE